jgi:hypothetical protein
MDRVVDVFWAIEQSPMDYLPERTIGALWHFLSGYSGRLRMQGIDSNLRHLYSPFQDWLEKKYELLPTTSSVYAIVDSISDGPESALADFYMLFKEFQKDHATIQSRIVPETVSVPIIDLCELLRMIRRTPALYVGFPHFSGVCAHIMGHLRAGRDVGILKTPDEVLFESFTYWIENQWRQGNDTRPWYKRVRFASFHDCGFSPNGAFTVFFKLLDEFAAKIERPGLYEVENGS